MKTICVFRSDNFSTCIWLGTRSWSFNFLHINALVITDWLIFCIWKNGFGKTKYLVKSTRDYSLLKMPYFQFPSWQPEMFRFLSDLRTLGIGETPVWDTRLHPFNYKIIRTQISVIPSNAFVHTPNLQRLEMSEAAVDTIEPGAFQRTPLIEAIVLNKNRLRRIRADMFQGLRELYSLDLQGNRLETVDQFGFAALPSLRHLDIRYCTIPSAWHLCVDLNFLWIF